MTASFNLARHCLTSAGAPGGKPALVVAEGPAGRIVETWSYDALGEAVRGAAGGLGSLGLERGDRVLLRIGNSSLFPVLFFGAIAGGYVPIPSSTQLSEDEVDFILADSGARAVIADGSGALPREPGGAIVLGPEAAARLPAGRAAGFAATEAEDPAFLVYTSGTSGRPKGVLHAQRVILGRVPMYRGWYGIGAEDRLFHAGAFNWTYTLGAGLMDPWANGATSVVHLGERPPEIWPDLIEATEATLFAAVPGLYRRMLKYAALDRDRMPRLRHGLTAGEALKANIHAEWVERTGRPLFEALGMSEISTYVSSGPEAPTRPGSPGRPQAGRRLAVLPVAGGEEPLAAGETGVLAIDRSDPGLMLGYWGRPEDTAAAFRGRWFLTGDLARFDRDGYVWYEGRSDDQMNASGYRVAPEEVERVLCEHPDVAEAAVAEVPRGEVSVIAAFVVPRAGAAADEASLIAHAAAHLADYKRPRAWIFVDELPRTATGKVLRKGLRAFDTGFSGSGS